MLLKIKRETSSWGAIVLLILLASVNSRAYSQTYCTPDVVDQGRTYEKHIPWVQMGEIYNKNWETYNMYNNSNRLVGYGNYLTETPATIFESRAFNVYYTASYEWYTDGSSDGTPSYSTAVYVDWNQDGDFDDAGETALKDDKTRVPVALTIKPPSNLIIGDIYRIRIMLSFGEGFDLDPCSTDTYEYHDYQLQVGEWTYTNPNGIAGDCSNVDFESGDLTGWEAFTGSNDGNGNPPPGTSNGGCCTDAGVESDGIDASIRSNRNRHTIVTPGDDELIGNVLQKVTPEGGNFSLRLGQSEGGRRAEMVQTTFTVTEENPIYSYDYAVVMDEPGHAAWEQPYFQATLFDANGRVIPCSYQRVTAGIGFEFDTAYVNGSNIVLYKPWDRVFINLYDYIGQDVTVEFKTGDCTKGAHFAYAYIDSRCEPLHLYEETHLVCEGESVTLTAPDAGGNFTYQWHKRDLVLGNIDLGTSRSITDAPTRDTTIYELMLDPPNGCPILLLDTIITVEPLEVSAPTIQCNEDNTFTATFLITNGDPDSYNIDGVDGTLKSIGNGIWEFTTDSLTIKEKNILVTVTDDNDCAAREIELNQTCPVHCKAFPIISAGTDGKVCMEQAISFQDAVARDADEGFGWNIINGNGTLDDTASLTPSYLSTVEDAGDTLYFELIGFSGNEDQELCADQKDTMFIYVEKQPSVEAGDDGEICSADIFNVVNADTNYAAGFIWTSNGDGFLENDTTLSPIYHPVQSDLDNGEVQLYLLAIGKSPCINAQDTVKITFAEDATADAGEDQFICITDTLIHSSAIVIGGTPGWTHDGDGEIINPDSVEFTYIPSESDAGDTVTFVLVSNVDDPCIDAYDTLKVAVTPLPIVDAGSDGRICGIDSYTVDDAIVENVANFTWNHNGSGTLENITSLSPTYSPGVGDYGKTVTLTILGSAILPCANTNDSLKIEVLQPPFVKAGDSVSVCAGLTVDLLGTILIADSISWTHDGDGEIVISDSIPAYVSVLNDSNSLVNVIVTAYGDDLCPSMTDTIPVFVAEPLLVEAGTGGNVCKAGSFTITDASASNATATIWSHNGAGRLEDIDGMTPTYFPGTTDIDKIITIRFVALAEEPCVSVEDSLQLNVTGNAFARAGDPRLICAGSSVQIDDAYVYGETSYSWSHTGNGTLDTTDKLQPIYTSTATEGDSEVLLILFAKADAPCESYIDTTQIRVVSPPELTIGNDTVMCYSDQLQFLGTTTSATQGLDWTHNGSGQITLSNTLEPIYVASPADAGKSVTLKISAYADAPCSVIEDSAIIVVREIPLVDAGASSLACEDVPFLVDDASVQKEVSFVWTHNGIGDLVNPTSISPIYTPAIGEAGDLVILTLTAQAESPCPEVIHTKELTIIAAPEIDAGSDAEICIGETYEIMDAIGDRYTSLNWTHNGNGIIQKNGTLSAVYVPGEEDGGKDVILTIVADPITPCLAPAVDIMTITVLPSPIVSAGDRATICGGENYTLNGSASNYSSYQWELVVGNGQLTNIDGFSPTYIATPKDIGTTVKIRIIAQGDGSCPPVTDLVKLRVVGPPEVDAGEPGEICISDVFELNGSVKNAASFIWSHDGCGTFENSSSTTPTYRPCWADRNKVVSITLTGIAANPCQQDEQDITYIRVIPSPGIYAGYDHVICAGESVEFTNSTSSNELDINWEVIGGNDAQLENGNSLIASYQTEVSEGGIVLQFVAHANPLAPCVVEAVDTVQVVVEVIPEFSLEDGNICVGQSYTMTINPINVYPVNVYDWYTEEIGGELVHTGEVYEVSGLKKTIQYWVEPSRGCKGARVPVIVNVHPEPVAYFKSDTTIITEQIVNVPVVDLSENTATGIWTWGDGTSSEYIPSSPIDHLYSIEVGEVPSSYKIQLDVESDQGCKDSYQIIIPVELKWAIYLPNAFSPNGDGINDEYGAKGFGIINFEMLIFNRWGDLIFEGDDMELDLWDGSDHIMNNGTIISKDKTKKLDTYVYKVKILNVFGEEHVYRGEVNLIR